MTAEIELKLAIDPGAVAATIRALARHPALATVKCGRWRTAQVVSTYLDTPDWRLSREGVALRLRRDGVRWLQTVKGPPLPGAGGALHARPEYEWPVAGPTLDAARLATTPWRRLLGGAIANGTLAPRFTTDFERRTLPLRFPDGTRATLCVDAGEIRVAANGRRGGKVPPARVPIAEIEIELASPGREGDATRGAAAIFALAQALAADLPLGAAVANKAARGVALVRGTPDGFDAPVRAGMVAFAPGATAADAIRAIALECLQQVAGNAAGLCADADVEWVHQMRIGTRRLRACLALAARVAPAATLAPLVAEVRWLAGVLGTARDLDVFATETLPRFVARSHAAPPSRPALARLRGQVTAERRRARAAAREAVAGPRFLRLLLAVGAWAAAPDWNPPPAADAAARDRAAAPATALARRVIARRHRQLVRLARTGLAGTAPERHAMRIAAKKLRYATEFFVPLFGARRAADYLAALAGLQDVLGRANDAATAMRLATAHAGDDDALAAGVRGWAAAEAAGTDAPLAAAWKRLAKAGRFWKKD